MDKARTNAPLTVLTLERAVSIHDYQDFARAFAGIAKAHALWIPSGSARGVFLTVAGEQGAAVPEASDTHRNLQAALHRYGDPLMPLTLVSYRDARFRLRLAVKVAADADSALVLPAIRSAPAGGVWIRGARLRPGRFGGRSGRRRPGRRRGRGGARGRAASQRRPLAQVRAPALRRAAGGLDHRGAAARPSCSRSIRRRSCWS